MLYMRRAMSTQHKTFFFSSRRRHTRWPRDWSSDVCSSDLSRCSVVIDSSSGGVQLRLVEAISMIGGDVPRVHPPLGDHGPLGRAGPAPGPFDGRTRVGAAPVQFGEDRKTHV